MNGNLPHVHTAPLLRRSELPGKTAGTAKAGLRKTEKELTWDDLSWCLRYVQYQSALNLDEFARELGRDPRQVKRMQEATERPQIELIWPKPALRALLIVAMAKRGGGFDVNTTLILRTA